MVGVLLCWGGGRMVAGFRSVVVVVIYLTGVWSCGDFVFSEICAWICAGFVGWVVLLLTCDWLGFGSFGFVVLVAPSSLCDFECLFVGLVVLRLTFVAM